MKVAITIMSFVLVGTLSAQPIAELSGAFQQGLAGVSSTMTGTHASMANPAGIAAADSLGLEISYGNPFSLSGYHRLAGGLVLPFGEVSAISASVRQERVASLRNSVVTLAYARQLSSRLRLGLQADWVQIAIDGFGNQTAIVPEIGLQYEAIRQVTLSAHIVAPGEIELVEGQPIPSQLDVGMLYQPSRNVDCHLAIRKIVDRPAEVVAAVDYEMHPRLAFRLGANAGTGSFTAGASLGITETMMANLAFVYHDRLGATPVAGFHF